MTDDASAADVRTDSHGLSRRRVLKAAGHAAWAIPAIQVVSMAPAFAAASDQLAITAASGTWNLTGNYVDCSVTVQNNSTTDATLGLQVTLTFPNFYVSIPINLIFFTFYLDATISFSNITSGWSHQPVSYSASSSSARVGTVVFTAPTQLLVGASTTLNFRVTTTRDVTTASGADTIAVVATATNFVSGSGAIDPT